MSLIGKQTPLALLHGWGMNRAIWSPVVDRLSARRPVHVLELPGHGDAPIDLHHTELVDWAHACLEQAPERAVWLGWSLGGMVTMQAALDSPQRIAALVCVASSPRFVQMDDNVANVTQPWETIGLQLAIQEGTGGGIVDPLFEQGKGDRHDHRSVDLALRGHGVHNQSHVLNCDEFVDLDDARVRVHGDVSHLHASHHRIA